MHYRDYFSLLELIIVISIITIIAVLVLPGIQKVKSLSERVVCTNNLKQIATGSFIYQQSYREFTMPVKFASRGNYNHWANYVYEQIPVKDIFKCPALDEADYFNPSGGTGNILEASYIMNIIDNSSAAWSGARIDSPPEDSYGWGTLDRPLHSSDVNSPSDSIYILDIMEGGLHHNHSGVNYFSRTDHGTVSNPPHGFVRWVGQHHNGGFNLLFGDLHAEYLEITDHNDWVVKID